MSRLDPRIVDYAQLRREMKEQDRKRQRHPAMDLDLDRVWAVYVWRDESWLLAGFARKPRGLCELKRLKKIMRRARRRCGITRFETADFVDLWKAQESGGPSSAPPQRFGPRDYGEKFRDEVDLGPEPYPKQRARKYHKSLAVVASKETKFIVLGRTRIRQWMNGSVAPKYLGPLDARTKRDAKREAQQMFGATNDIVIVNVEQLSKSQRRRLRRGRLIPSVTKLTLTPSKETN